ncbi:MAG: efflux RND transporter periplasmic adaptor subunit [Burkholderiaceae bacterium]
MKIPPAALGRIAVTLLVVALAVVVALRLWRHYEVEPWTRDGRVKTDIVQVAPDVTGLVTTVAVRDNQPVQAGQLLFEIDPARFTLALRQAEAVEHAQRTALEQAEREAQRNVQLHDLVAQETREQGRSRVEQARAALEQAVVSRDTARLNLARTRVVAPAAGTVTNLDLRPGDYATAGRAVLALVDRNAFYVEGYFEETKLEGIHVGDAARVLLMGQRAPLDGHVESFARGIADRDRSTGNNLLPNINPTFNWVRLAQRVPVRIALDRIPPDARLVAGQTATVEVLGPRPRTAAAPAAAHP